MTYLPVYLYHGEPTRSVRKPYRRHHPTQFKQWTSPRSSRKHGIRLTQPLFLRTTVSFRLIKVQRQEGSAIVQTAPGWGVTISVEIIRKVVLIWGMRHALDTDGDIFRPLGIVGCRGIVYNAFVTMGQFGGSSSIKTCVSKPIKPRSADSRDTITRRREAWDRDKK